jgi:hypothetical protein
MTVKRGLTCTAIFPPLPSSSPRPPRKNPLNPGLFFNAHSFEPLGTQPVGTSGMMSGGVKNVPIGCKFGGGVGSSGMRKNGREIDLVPG